MKNKQEGRRRSPGLIGAVTATAAVALAVSACAPSSAPGNSSDGGQAELGISDSDYSLEALIEAAKNEDPIVVLDTTGKIVDIASAFSERYGVQATGVKMKSGEQAEVVIREGTAGTVMNDVMLLPDVPTAVSELIPRGFAASWFPPDMTDVVEEQFQDPAVVTQETNVWAYNTEVYGDVCPVDNIWQLTDEEWAGRVSLQDPLLTDQAHWFNQMQSQGDDLMAGAYADEYGDDLQTEEDSATAEWVKRLAMNSPVLTNSDDDIAESVGAPGQSDPFIGFFSTAKFRANVDSGYKLGVCEGLDPWAGRAYTKAALIATGTESPNAAKLFVRFMFTEEGIGTQTEDGKVSTNSTIKLPSDDPSHLESVWDQILVFDSATAADDFDNLQEWQDFWRASIRS